MKILETPLDGVRIIEAPRHHDARGWFGELWNAERYAALGLGAGFVQQNVSYSNRGVLRGMHFQVAPHAQTKLVTVLTGAVYDVVVDVRRDSSSFGRWYGLELSEDKGRQLWVPEGFAHGFMTLADGTMVHYGCTRAYEPGAERVLLWSDADIGIDWPQEPSALSSRDATAPRLREIDTQLSRAHA